MTRTIAIVVLLAVAACTTASPGGHIDGFNAAAPTPGAMTKAK